MIYSQSLQLSAQTLPPNSVSDSGRSGGTSFVARNHDGLSLKKSNTDSSRPLPPRALLRASSFQGKEFERVLLRYFDGNGKISASELCNCLRSIGEELSLQDAEAFLDSPDTDGDGKLSYEDFLKLVEVEKKEERGRALRQAFAVFEMEGRSCITERSLRRALQRLGEERRVEECRDMIKRFDLNGDGVVCFEEFKIMMMCK